MNYRITKSNKRDKWRVEAQLGTIDHQYWSPSCIHYDSLYEANQEMDRLKTLDEERWEPITTNRNGTTPL